METISVILTTKTSGASSNDFRWHWWLWWTRWWQLTTRLHDILLKATTITRSTFIPQWVSFSNIFVRISCEISSRMVCKEWSKRSKMCWSKMKCVENLLNGNTCSYEISSITSGGLWYFALFNTERIHNVLQSVWIISRNVGLENEPVIVLFGVHDQVITSDFFLKLDFHKHGGL